MLSKLIFNDSGDFMFYKFQLAIYGFVRLSMMKTIPFALYKIGLVAAKVELTMVFPTAYVSMSIMSFLG